MLCGPEAIARAMPVSAGLPVCESRQRKCPRWRDCRRDVEELAGKGRYDAIYAVWPSDGTVPLCGWGCTAGPAEGSEPWKKR